MAFFQKIILFLVFYLIQLTISAQCAMCKAVVESDIQSGGTKGLGINDGIVYLMGIPYLLMGVVGYFFYKHYKKNNLNSEIGTD